MKQNALIRFLLLLLCISLLVGSLVACGIENTKETDTTADTTEETNEEEIPTEPKYVEDGLPADLKFDRDFVLLGSLNQRSHFWAEETATGTVDSAIYQRNSTVEARLGITIKWDFRATSSSSDKSNFVNHVETDIQAGNKIDAVVTYNLIPYSLAVKGHASNLADTEYIDLEGPWWPSEYLDSMLYNGKIYALVSSCGVGTLTNLSGIFFNNTLLENKSLEDPYTLVKNNEWTLGKLKELIKDTYEDKNQNGKDDELDVYGLCTSSAPRITCWYYGAGARLSELDANGELQLIANDTEKLNKVIDTLVDLFSTKNSLIYESDATRYTVFREERVYFYLSDIGLSSHLVNNNAKVDYGVVPNPKFDSAQTRYYTHLPNAHDAWFVPKGVNDMDCSSAVLECMASEAYRQLNEVFFETNLKLRYAPDERLAEMYDLIRESITFDFAYIYKEVLSKNCDYAIIDCIRYPETKKWSTSWASMKDLVNTDFLKILDLYQN
ncbi:MAG: hypothetical protein E7629_07525 [Ruminococcaceae bacterium]|nr:hypothetical protein [Oscillospiraceae bacterium]